MTEYRQKIIQEWILQQINVNIAELENLPIRIQGYIDEVRDDTSDLQVVHGWSLHGSRGPDEQRDENEGEGNRQGELEVENEENQEGEE